AGVIAIREDAVGGARREQGIEGAWQRGIDVHALRQVHGAVVGVRHRYGGGARQLPFDTDGALQAIVRLQLGVHHVDQVRTSGQRGKRRNIRVERGVVDGVVHLVDAVVQNGVLERRGADAIVED